MAVAAWLSDPAGRHQYRWHDGASWTDWVHDQGTTANDPLEYGPTAHREQTAGATAALAKMSSWSESQALRAAGWVNRKHKGQPGADEIGLLDYQASPSILGQWSGLSSAVGKYAVAASGVANGGELLGVLHAVTGSEDAQAQLLRSIDAKVDALVKGQYNTGRTYLREAARHSAIEEPARPDIERALACFFLAHGQAASVQSRALVEYHLGLTSLLLDQQSDAIHWLAQSHASASVVVTELAKQASDIKVLHSHGSTAVMAWMYPAGIVVLGMKFKKMVAAEQRRDTLESFLPFVGCVARSHNCLVGPGARLPTLELRPLTVGQYELASIEL